MAIAGIRMLPLAVPRAISERLLLQQDADRAVDLAAQDLLSQLTTRKRVE